jgi:hypothetical protein
MPSLPAGKDRQAKVKIIIASIYRNGTGLFLVLHLYIFTTLLVKGYPSFETKATPSTVAFYFL